MAIAFRQLITASETSAVPTTVFLPSDPVNGSTLIAVVACIGTASVSRIRHGDIVWQLLYENDGQVEADENANDAVRVQIWGAFNIQSAIDQIGFEFSGETTERGIIVAEYTGHGFEFPNPADRVIGDTGVGFGLLEANLDTGIGGVTRETDELWVAGAASSRDRPFQNPDGDPFDIRTQIEIGSPAGGQVALLDSVDLGTRIRAVQMTVDQRSAAAIANWAAVMAALRGTLQVPNDGPDEPTSAEPVTENTDHYGTAIGHLLEQFKSRDKD